MRPERMFPSTAVHCNRHMIMRACWWLIPWSAQAQANGPVSGRPPQSAGLSSSRDQQQISHAAAQQAAEPNSGDADAGVGAQLLKSTMRRRSKPVTDSQVCVDSVH